MINHYKKYYSSFYNFILKLLLIFSMVFCGVNLNAQQKPPRPMKASTYQHLNFGTIIQGNFGGTVIMSSGGVRSSTGDLILPPVGSSGTQAIFEIKALQGTLITLLLGSSALSNGAYSMNLVVGPADPVSPFIIPKGSGGTVFVNVGGTLSVGNASQNPAGNYSGIFTVTFIQQ